MSFPTPEQWLLLGGVILAAVLVVVIVAALVRRARGRRTALLTEELERTAEPLATGPSPAGGEPEPTRTVADAVHRALVVREARGGDVRDRLLAVLLEDPVRAVDATVELDTCRRQLERLTGAVEHERAALRAVLGRLAATGLSDEQLARLAQLSVREVRDLLGLARDALQPR